MKICENCGREYGDDNPFCPFCDERYGVVILADDVISADGLPPYKEEFPVIGETGVKQESFAANRDKIYKRNIRLAARENFLPKMEVRAAYKPVVPLAEVDRNGEIIPYKPPNLIVQKLGNVGKNLIAKQKKGLSKTAKAVLGVLSVAAVFFAVVGFSWFETTDTYADYEQAKIDKEYEKIFPDWNTKTYAAEQNAETIVTEKNTEITVTEKITYDAEEFSVSIPEEIIITGENGLEMKLTNGSGWELISKQNGNIIKTEKMYCFDFEFTNATDYNMRTFWNEFPNYADDVRWIYISKMGDRNVHQTIEFNDGVPDPEKSYSIHPNETAIGSIHINFNNQFDLTKD